MQTLLDGYRRFRARGWPAARQTFESLSEHGQAPHALVVGCVDSRVDPGVIFDAAPGTMLTVRNVANLVPPYAPDAAYHGTSAALEFGIRVLRIPHLVVLGHGQCGGVSALLNGAPLPQTDFVAQWMQIAAAARDTTPPGASPPARQLACEQECIRISLRNLRSFPWIAEAERAGNLALHGAWFAIRTGELTLLQADGNFVPA